MAIEAALQHPLVLTTDASHIFGLQHLSWLAGAHVTRFISLAEVGNTSKQKFLHALGLVPAADMDLATLKARPANTTPSPYEEAAASRKRPLDHEGGDDMQVMT